MGATAILKKGGVYVPMRTYEVRVLVPKLELIEAEDETDLFEKVGKLYKELYRHEAWELIQLLPEPEDFA
jgi:hypothetical protein